MAHCTCRRTTGRRTHKGMKQLQVPRIERTAQRGLLARMGSCRAARAPVRHVRRPPASVTSMFSAQRDLRPVAGPARRSAQHIRCWPPASSHSFAAPASAVDGTASGSASSTATIPLLARSPRCAVLSLARDLELLYPCVCARPVVLRRCACAMMCQPPSWISIGDGTPFGRRAPIPSSPGARRCPVNNRCPPAMIGVIGTRRLLLSLGTEDDERGLRMLGGLRIGVNEK